MNKHAEWLREYSIGPLKDFDEQQVMLRTTDAADEIDRLEAYEAVSVALQKHVTALQARVDELEKNRPVIERSRIFDTLFNNPKKSQTDKMVDLIKSLGIKVKDTPCKYGHDV